MSEPIKIAQFNQQLDILLGIPGPGRDDDQTLDSEEMEILQAAARLDSISFEGEPDPWPGLKESWINAHIQPERKPRPFLRIVLVGLIFLAVAAALLIPFRQPVLASLGSLFGYLYISGEGFVPIDTVRILKNPVMQMQKDRSLLVINGLAGSLDTQLWLKYDVEAQRGEGTWLEAPDGTRFDLTSWEKEPDEPGAQDVRLVFPRLPKEISQVTLVMMEGWRIILDWVPASESNMRPGGNLTPMALSTPMEPAQKPTREGDPADLGNVQSCSAASGVSFCVTAATFGDNGIEVLVEALASDILFPGAFLGRNLVETYIGGQPLELLDNQSNAYMPAGNISIQQDLEERLTTAITFPNTSDLTGQLVLKLPAIYAHTSLTKEIEIDLGPEPYVGQQLTIDETVEVAGSPVHFRRAWVDGDSVSTLRLFIASDPVETTGGITPYFLEMGKPEGIDDRFGGGTGEGILSFQVELLQTGGKKTGVLRFPIVGATVIINGPFSLVFNAPVDGVALQPSPEVIEGDEFIPLAVGEPLAMDAYYYSGLSLQPGDFIVASVQGDTSRLYASNLTNEFSSQLLAVLPGQVLAAYIHPDRQGMDYLTGDSNIGSEPVINQLYTLRFGLGIPHLVVGAFQSKDNGFIWSADGQWLAYFSPRSGTGENGLNRLALIDLSCREAGSCQSKVVPVQKDLDLFEMTWSPVENRLAIQGIPPEQENGLADIFTVTVDGQTGIGVLTNLTNSPQTDDRFPQWALDGSTLMYPCKVGDVGINEYGLCRNTLVQNMDELVVRLLPFNMGSAVLTLDSQNLIDRFPVFENDLQRLRIVNLESGETRPLMEWKAGETTFHEPLLSPDGSLLAVIEPGKKSLVVVDLVGGLNIPLQIGDSGVLYWGGWVK